MAVYVTYQTVLLAADPKGIWLSAYPDVYERQPDRIGQVRSLATEAGVASRVDWKAVAAVLKRADGMIVNVATAGGPIPVKPAPKPMASPSARPTITPTVQPTATPSPSPTVAPTVAPTATPSALPTTAATVAPGPLPTGLPGPVSSETAPVAPPPAATPVPTPSPTEDERPL
jgi:hypothetical protein